jgi:hypothetical protein
VKIKSIYDQTIYKSIYDDDGKFVAYEATTDHYVFGKVGDEITGGFYVKTGTEAPEFLEIEIKRRLTNKGKELIKNK